MTRFNQSREKIREHSINGKSKETKRQRDIIIQTVQNETLTPKPSKPHLSISF